MKFDLEIAKTIENSSSRKVLTDCISEHERDLTALNTLLDSIDFIALSPRQNEALRQALEIGYGRKR